MAKQNISVETEVPEILIGQYYAYIYKGKLCVGKAVKHPIKKTGYDWAMENCYSGKTDYPYQMDIISPNCKISDVTATVAYRERY